MYNINQNNYIKVEDAIRAVEKARNEGLISPRAAETIIGDLYHQLNKNPWKTPK